MRPDQQCLGLASGEFVESGMYPGSGETSKRVRTAVAQSTSSFVTGAEQTSQRGRSFWLEWHFGDCHIDI